MNVPHMYQKPSFLPQKINYCVRFPHAFSIANLSQIRYNVLALTTEGETSMFKCRLSTLFIGLLTLTASFSANAQILRTVAYEEFSTIMIAQITLSDDTVFIQTTLKDQPSEVLSNWDEGDTIIVSSTIGKSGKYQPSHEVTLVNETKNQSLLVSATEETVKALPKIDSINFETIKRLLIFSKEKAIIGLSNGIFYQTEDDAQVTTTKCWEVGDRLIISDLARESRPPEALLINLDKPSAYRTPTEKQSEQDYRKIVVNPL